ncbi:DAK2 domain fusion protein YloV [Symbiobacterium terraclitae]|uniref:DAK2 domain fusion protein YloV n=1 Tax=Symbiobacterium terraclitae TaxID=557451 RepID=A0ABS4JVZ4_9FIRM|nr:DAK2 domain-containing protein [Symbiobacterium terraclitae]MBP2019723.1 DAK2 domain fusion protein YloV [Symbiobacterium terraclitae]
MSIQTIDGKALKQMILHAAARLEAQKDAVNALNVFPVPDGDTGTNMSMTLSSATREVERAGDRTVGEVAAALAQGSLMGARGNSGVILSQLFRGFAKYLDGKTTVDGRELARALQEGVDTAYKAVMKPVEGTILTVAREAAAAAQQAGRKSPDATSVMRAAVEAAEEALAKTPELLPVLKKAGVVDSGGKGLTVIYHGYYEVLSGKASDVATTAVKVEPAAEAPAPGRHDTSPASRVDFAVDEEISDIRFPYDCEFFIRRYRDGGPIPMDNLARELEQWGDSVYVVGSEDLAKVHVHASNPGPVLSLAIQYGDLIDIVIHNMREQHADLLRNAQPAPAGAHGGAAANPSGNPGANSGANPGASAGVNPTGATSAPADSPAEEERPTAVVAVAAGEGMAEIFRSLGVSAVIQGGQTMNPSTQDLLDAIERCPSRQVFVLPNNKNIILAAEQAATLTQKKVYVVPTRSVPQGISAMVAWMPDEEDGERLFSSMKQVIEGVHTGEITYAVRDTTYGDLQIKEGDILGLWNGKIHLTGKEPEGVLVDLLSAMVEEAGGEVITVYYGEGVAADRAEAVGEELRRRFPDHEVEIQFGGQPLYYYVFSLE